MLDGIDWSDCPAVLPLRAAGGGHCGFYDLRAESLAVRALGAFFLAAAEGRAPDAAGPGEVTTGEGGPLRTPAAATAP
jgi:hypothetical protein